MASKFVDVNVSQLPSLQAISPGDLLIIQTPAGTQIIDFSNVNFVKTDLLGNALINNSLSAKNVLFVSANIASLSAAAFSSLGKSGVTLLPDYYNNFTITNGLVTSATYVVGSPEYDFLTSTYIPAITAYQTTIYSSLTSGLALIADQNGTAVIGTGNSSSTVTINNFFNNYPISVANITPAHFTLAAAADIGTIPYISNITNSSQNLQFQVNLGGTTITGATLFWRLLITYRS